MNSKLFIFFGVFIEIASVIVTVFSAIALNDSSEKAALAHFEQQIERGMQAADNRLEQYKYALISGAALFNIHPEISRDEWKSFVESLEIKKNYPGVSGFGYIRSIPSHEIDSFLASAKANNAPEFKIKTLGTPPEGNRYIIDYIEPIAQNLPAQGLDIGSHVVRRKSADAAMTRGDAQVTNIIKLVQDNQKLPGFLMLYPVYKNKVIPKSIEVRKRDLLGWTYAPFVGEKVMAGVSDIAGKDVQFKIFDQTIKLENMIYGNSNLGENFYTVTREIKMGLETWLFTWTTDKIYADGSLVNNEKASWVIFFGFMTSSGLLIVMLLLHRSNRISTKKMKEALVLGEIERDKALESSKAKSQFLANMSHELRTPLNSINVLSELLVMNRKGNLTEKDILSVQTINSSGESLLSLINDILDLSKIESGHQEVEKKSFELQTFINDLMSEFEAGFIKKGIELKVCVEENFPVTINTDEQRLKQILRNLISNAFKFTDKGLVEVHLFIASEKLTFKNASIDDFIFLIKDSGIGIPLDKQEEVFAEFTQVQMGKDRQYQGTGLGLTLSQSMARMLGADITLVSEEGSGSEFALIFPRSELC